MHERAAHPERWAAHADPENEWELQGLVQQKVNEQVHQDGFVGPVQEEAGGPEDAEVVAEQEAGCPEGQG